MSPWSEGELLPACGKLVSASLSRRQCIVRQDVSRVLFGAHAGPVRACCTVLSLTGTMRLSYFTKRTPRRVR